MAEEAQNRKEKQSRLESKERKSGRFRGGTCRRNEKSPPAMFHEAGPRVTAASLLSF